MKSLKVYDFHNIQVAMDEGPQNRSVSYNSYFYSSVIPDMYFTINGNQWRNISTITVTSNQLLTVTCHADGTRPVIQLRWELDIINVDTISVPVSSKDNQAFNITSVLKFVPNET